MERRIGFDITLLARSISLKMSEVMRPFGLTAGEQPFMAQLYRRDGITQEELTDLVHVDKSVTARAIGTLEAKGYVRREPNESDGRSKRVFLTEKAQAAHGPFREALEDFGDRLTVGLDEEDLETAAACIESMQAALDDQPIL